MSHSRTMGGRMKNRRGALILFVAVSMVGLLGLVAIAADIGAAQRQRRIPRLGDPNQGSVAQQSAGDLQRAGGPRHAVRLPGRASG